MHEHVFQVVCSAGDPTYYRIPNDNPRYPGLDIHLYVCIPRAVSLCRGCDNSGSLCMVRSSPPIYECTPECNVFFLL